MTVGVGTSRGATVAATDRPSPRSAVTVIRMGPPAIELLDMKGLKELGGHARLARLAPRRPGRRPSTGRARPARPTTRRGRGRLTLAPRPLSSLHVHYDCRRATLSQPWPQTPTFYRNLTVTERFRRQRGCYRPAAARALCGSPRRRPKRGAERAGSTLLSRPELGRGAESREWGGPHSQVRKTEARCGARGLRRCSARPEPRSKGGGRANGGGAPFATKEDRECIEPHWRSCWRSR